MVYINCDCGSDTFHINFKPPLRAEAVCTECEYTVEIGGDNQADAPEPGIPGENDG